jgi:hypothetical protein
MNRPHLLDDFAATSASCVVKDSTALCLDGTVQRADVVINNA